ncbi:MAG: hypothetical protein ACI915_001652 [Gammaproteobacteria bacterium]|jgi:hypothetical protein
MYERLAVAFQALQDKTFSAEKARTKLSLKRDI